MGLQFVTEAFFFRCLCSLFCLFSSDVLPLLCGNGCLLLESSADNLCWCSVTALFATLPSDDSCFVQGGELVAINQCPEISSLPWSGHHRPQPGTLSQGRPREGHKSQQSRDTTGCCGLATSVSPPKTHECASRPPPAPWRLISPLPSDVGNDTRWLPGIPETGSVSLGFLGRSSGQSPTYLAVTHKNKANELEGHKSYENKYGWRSPPGHFAADGLDWPGEIWLNKHGSLVLL